MKAVLVKENRELVWSDVPDPQPREGEVLIRVHATALNRADLMQRVGKYPPPPGWPEWMGLEVAGEVLQAPAGSRWHPGDRVCALLGGGGYAEMVAAPTELLLPVPPGLSMEEAAALPEAFATSYLNLCLEAQLAAGETLFLQAGASGLGMVAIQMAKWLGARVVTTVGSEEKARFVRALGADVVVNYKNENVAAVLAQNPPDVALDCVAGPEIGQYLQTMNRGGRWVIIATLGGPTAELDLNHFFRTGLKLVGSTLRSRPPETKARIMVELEQKFWPALERGELKSILHKVLPITEAEAAHDILKRNENLGKVVLTVPH